MYDLLAQATSLMSQVLALYVEDSDFSNVFAACEKGACYEP